jgi:hypothetical protein
VILPPAFRTHRCTVENGAIQLPPGTRIADGTEVEIVPLTKPRKLKPAHKAFGMWKSRRDLGKDPVKTLRVRSRRRRTGA